VKNLTQKITSHRIKASRQVVAITLLMALLGAVGVSQQKSVTEVAIVVEYVEKPTTLERATARAHAIVRARVVGSQFRKLIEPGAPVPHVSTAEIPACDMRTE
jgi:gluconate kinase